MTTTTRQRPERFQQFPSMPQSYGWAKGLGLNDLTAAQLLALVPEVRPLFDETRGGARADAELVLGGFDRIAPHLTAENVEDYRQQLLGVAFTLGESAARTGAYDVPTAAEARDAHVWQVFADALDRIGA